MINLTESYRRGIKYMPAIREVEGWLTDGEGFLLYQYSTYNLLGETVEIGSFKGKSTIWLAAGVRDRGKDLKVHAVDWHKGSDEFKIGTLYTGAGIWTGSSLETFKQNIEKFQLGDYVNPIIKKSREAIKTWTEPIGLLFIDGDHSYDECRFDFINWTKFVPVGGTVIIHDAVTWDGPKAVVNELITSSDKWIGYSFESMVVATKVK